MAGENSLFKVAKAKGYKGEALTPAESEELMEEQPLEKIVKQPKHIADYLLQYRDIDKEKEKDENLFRRARKRGDSKKDVLTVEYISENN